MTISPVTAQRLWHFMLLIGGAALAIASFDEARWGVAQTTAEPGMFNYEPWYGDALTLLSDREQNALATPQIAVARARAALRGQALNARALRQLAIVDQSTGDERGAMALIQASSAVTRREFGTQIWLVNHYASAGDVKQALVHYDLALRANGNAAELLFPILTRALSVADVRTGLANFLRADVPWMPAFLNYAIAQTVHPEDVAAFLVEAGGMPNDSAYEGLLSAFLSRVVTMNQYDLARRTYLSLHAGPTRLLAAPDFVTASADNQLGPFGWQLTATPTIGASFVSEQSGAPVALDVFAASSETALVARKLLYLTPGRYGFRLAYAKAQMGSAGSATWQLQCAKAATVTTIWKFAPAVRADGENEAVFDLPTGCDATYLDLVVAGGDDQLGSHFGVRKLAVAKL